MHVYGDLSANSVRATQRGMASTSTIYGNQYGEIEVCENATVEIHSGANLYALGFVYGDGNVIVRSGASAYEVFTLVGWKGGTVSTGLKDDMFPVNQYTINNLIVDTEFDAGSNWLVKASASAGLGSWEITRTVDVTFMSNTNSAFIELAQGSFFKKVDESNGKVYMEFDGVLAFNNISITVLTYSFSTKGVQVPIPGNFNISVMEGSTVTIPENVQLKFLPGSTLTVAEGANMVVNSNAALYSYGVPESAVFDSGITEWQDSKAFKYPHANMSKVYRNSVEFDYTAASPAVINIEGSLTINDGGILAASISGTEGAKLNISENAVLSETIFEDNSTSSSGVTYQSTLTAYLVNADDTAVQAQKGNYTYTDGVWA